MTSAKNNRALPAKPAQRPGAARVTILTLSVAIAGLAGCRHIDDPVSPVSFSLVDPAERHPILVSQQPSTVSFSVPRGSYGLGSHQRSQLEGFLSRYRAGDAGNSKLVIQAPSGAANEIAAMRAVGEIRDIITDYGFDQSVVTVEAYRAAGKSHAPVRVSYLRYVAEGPKCGYWPTNLAREPYNLPYPNMGCATQANFAAMVSNPADLIGPRTTPPRPAERRDAVWQKYLKGDSTAAQKGDDEKIKTSNN